MENNSTNEKSVMENNLIFGFHLAGSFCFQSNFQTISSPYLLLLLRLPSTYFVLVVIFFLFFFCFALISWCVEMFSFDIILRNWQMEKNQGA